MNNTISVLNPVKEVKLSNSTVAVKELNWRDQRDILKSISEQIGQFASPKEPGDFGGNITKIISDSQDLSEKILEKTTGLSNQQMGELTISEFFALLDAALELNVSTLAGGSKKVFGRIGSLVGASAVVNRTPTTGSGAPSAT